MWLLRAKRTDKVDLIDRPAESTVSQKRRRIRHEGRCPRFQFTHRICRRPEKRNVCVSTKEQTFLSVIHGLKWPCQAGMSGPCQCLATCEHAGSCRQPRRRGFVVFRGIPWVASGSWVPRLSAAVLRGRRHTIPPVLGHCPSFQEWNCRMAARMAAVSLDKSSGWMA